MEETSTKNIYGNFWARFGAAIIDGIIVSIPSFILPFVLKNSFNQSDLQVIVSAITTLLAIVYAGFMESGAGQATLGKKALNLKVTNLEGEALNISEAFLRNILKNWANVVLVIVAFGFNVKPSEPDPANPMAVLQSDYIIVAGVLGVASIIGYLLAAFTPRRQAIHDIIAQTAVLKTNTKSSGTDDEW